VSNATTFGFPEKEKLGSARSAKLLIGMYRRRSRRFLMIPWKRDRHGNPIERKPGKARCNLCGREIFDNVNPEKIITCARCVIVLHEKAQSNPQELIEYRNSLEQKGLLEQARSVEAFIIPGDRDDIATFKRTLVLRQPSHGLGAGKPLPRMISGRI
jgi:hypothetical protein